MKNYQSILLMTTLAFGVNAMAQGAPSLKRDAPEGAEVYFIEPADQAVVSPSFRVVFGLREMGVAPAGVDIPATGHHHLLINQRKNVNFDHPLPSTEQVIHFGKGQTETVLELPPGEHTLQLLMGNFVHIPHVQPVSSKRITVNVKK